MLLPIFLQQNCWDKNQCHSHPHNLFNKQVAYNSTYLAMYLVITSFVPLVLQARFTCMHQAKLITCPEANITAINLRCHFFSPFFKSAFTYIDQAPLLLICPGSQITGTLFAFSICSPPLSYKHLLKMIRQHIESRKKNIASYNLGSGFLLSPSSEKGLLIWIRPHD